MSEMDIDGIPVARRDAVDNDDQNDFVVCVPSYSVVVY